jgi:hypothetical protein
LGDDFVTFGSHPIIDPSTTADFYPVNANRKSQTSSPKVPALRQRENTPSSLVPVSLPDNSFRPKPILSDVPSYTIRHKSEIRTMDNSEVCQRENTKNTREPPETDQDENHYPRGSGPVIEERALAEVDFGFFSNRVPEVRSYQDFIRSRYPKRDRAMPCTTKESDNANISDDLAAIENKLLRQQVDLLKAKLKKYESTEVKPPRLQFLYQLEEANVNSDSDDSPENSPSEIENPITTFTDIPEIVYEKNGVAHLRCSIPLRNFDLFLAQNPDISFIVFRHYKKKFQSQDMMDEQASQLPSSTSESIYPVASDMKSALNAMLDANPGFADIKKKYSESGDLLAPYLFAYHSRQNINKVKAQLSPVEIDHMDLLISYLNKEYGEEYKCVDYLLERGLIAPQYIHYLFKPGELLVEKVDDEYTGYVAQSWISKDPEESRESRRSEIFGGILGIEPRLKPQTQYLFPIRAWNFEFDGNFFRTNKLLSLSLTNEEFHIGKNVPPKPQSFEILMKTARPISDLNVFPLKHAPQTIVKTLQKRGKTLWKCRVRSLVSYKAQENEQSTEMVNLFPMFILVF